MKLSFRGINYEYEPVILEPSNQEIQGTYRGVHWKGHPCGKSRHHHEINNMIYRGIHYTQN